MQTFKKKKNIYNISLFDSGMLDVHRLTCKYLWIKRNDWQC